MKLAYGLFVLVATAQEVSRLQSVLEGLCGEPDATYVTLNTALHPDGNLPGQGDCRHGMCYLTQEEKIVCRNTKVVAGFKYSSAAAGPIITRAFLSPKKHFAKYDGVNIDYTDEPDDVEIILPTLVGNTKPHRLITVRVEQLPSVPKTSVPDHIFVHSNNPDHMREFEIPGFSGAFSVAYLPHIKKPSPFIERMDMIPEDDNMLPEIEEPKPRRTAYPFSSSNLKCIIFS